MVPRSVIDLFFRATLFYVMSPLLHHRVGTTFSLLGLSFSNYGRLYRLREPRGDRHV